MDANNINTLIGSVTTLVLAWMAWQQVREKARREDVAARNEASARRAEHAAETMETAVTEFTRATKEHHE